MVKFTVQQLLSSEPTPKQLTGLALVVLPRKEKGSRRAVLESPGQARRTLGRAADERRGAERPLRLRHRRPGQVAAEALEGLAPRVTRIQPAITSPGGNYCDFEAMPLSHRRHRLLQLAQRELVGDDAADVQGSTRQQGDGPCHIGTPRIGSA